MSRLRLNVGSGQRPFGKTWTNVDLQPKWHPDVVADADCMPEFADGTAELVVLHHFAEHLGVEKVQATLRECYRILAPSGSLIVVVPEMLEVTKGWLKGKINTAMFMTITYGAFMGDESDRHRWGYTELSLCEQLHQIAEWKIVKAFDWRSMEGSDFAAPDWWFCGVEAIK